MRNFLRIFDKIQRPSLRQGVIFGLALGGIEIVLWLLANFIQDANIQSILGTLALAAFVVLGFLAGQRAAQETGKMGTGVIAGIWTGLIGGILESLIPFIIDLIFLPTIVTNVQQDFKIHPDLYKNIKFSDITASYVFTSIATQLLYTVAVYTLIALLGGAFGGFMGRRRALATQNTYAEYEPDGEENMVEAGEDSAENVLPSPKKSTKSASVAEVDDSIE